jgi:hypothetical protein
MVASAIDNAVHNCRIEPEDDDLWMLKLLIKAERVGESRALRILRDHVHEPSMFFASLKNAFVVLA